mgnify:CR=1 FL=1
MNSDILLHTLEVISGVTKVYLFPEIEAVEACRWLRAAGFPQYAQMYEGNTTL